MTEQQKYDIFIAKLGDKITELKDDYSKLSTENQMRFLNMCQSMLLMHGVKVTTEFLNKFWGY